MGVALLPRLLVFLALISKTTQRRVSSKKRSRQKSDAEEEEELWKYGKLDEIYDTLDCPTKQAIHGHNTWKLLQSTYEKVVTKSSLPKGGYLGIDSFYVPYEIIKGPAGRGVIAKEFVPKGTLLWKSFQTARFEDPNEYRRYLREIPEELACDVIPWAYTRLERTNSNDMRVVVCVDLDPGSFLNDGLTKAERNARVEVPRWTGCDLEFRASRDISPGEEIRTSYLFSELDPGFAAMGLSSIDSTEEEEFDEDDFEDEFIYHDVDDDEELDKFLREEVAQQIMDMQISQEDSLSDEL